MVKDVPHLFQTRGLQAVGLIDNDQLGWVWSGLTLLSIGLGNIGRRCRRRPIKLDDIPVAPRWRLDLFRPYERLLLSLSLMLSLLLPQPGFDRERLQMMTFDDDDV